MNAWWNPPVKPLPHAERWLTGISMGRACSSTCPLTGESFSYRDRDGAIEDHLASCPLNWEQIPLVLHPQMLEMFEAGDGGWGIVRKRILARMDADVEWEYLK